MLLVRNGLGVNFFVVESEYYFVEKSFGEWSLRWIKLRKID